MGRKSRYSIGEKFGGLEIIEIIRSEKTGRHVKLKCLCHFCNNEKIIYGGNLKKRKSCGCQQNQSKLWKWKGPRRIPWQLPPGIAAKNNIKHQYKYGAKKRKLEYNLSEEDFDKLIIGDCFYCGDSCSQISKGQGKTSGNFNYTGIDRINSKLGYIEENCVSCCWICNSMKMGNTRENFINQIKKITQHLGKQE